MNKLSLLTIILTIVSISGLPPDYNGFPGIQEYYEKYKNSVEVDNLQMNIMQEAKSKIDDDYSSEIPSNNEDSNLESHLSYGSENAEDTGSKYPSFGTEDHEAYNSQDLPQSGDTYPTQSTNEDVENTSQDPNYGENKNSTATHAPSDWQSESLERTVDDNNETNTNVILHVEAFGDDQNNQSTVFDEHQESPVVEYHEEDNYKEDLNNTVEESNPLTMTELDEVDHNLTTVYHVSSTEVNETKEEDEPQFNNIEFMEQRYLEEENEFKTVLEDTEGDENNVTYPVESEGSNFSYHTEADFNQTNSYPDELDSDSTTASEYILSQTVVEGGYDTGNEEQTTKPNEIDGEGTYASEISDEEDFSQQTNLATESNGEEDDFEDEEDDYEEDDEDDYEDEKEEIVEGTNSYQDSTWSNDEAFTENGDFEETIEQLEKDAEELRESVLNSLATEIPVTPRYRSSIVPMLLLSLLVVGMLFFCTRAPAYCYNLFRIVRGADGFPFRRSLEKKGYMVLPMGDKSV